MMYTRVCEGCQQGFATYIHYQKYCSDACRDATNNQKQYERRKAKRRKQVKIVECGNTGCNEKVNTFRGRKFCSDKCRTAHINSLRELKPKEHKVCKLCGDEFESNIDIQRFCTPNCQVKWHTKQRSEHSAKVRVEKKAKVKPVRKKAVTEPKLKTYQPVGTEFKGAKIMLDLEEVEAKEVVNIAPKDGQYGANDRAMIEKFMKEKGMI